ncbi:MAG: FAD-dependent oxidoreductase, partial [bacterium]|nr:FAD-dependent oxidoreductase [Candidatus Kapabacteria bacterium]
MRYSSALACQRGSRIASPVVIGAGVAGLATAVELARAGHSPRLLESRPYVGGRARSFVHASGDEIDNGQHLLMGCYRATFRLLEMIGTRHLVEIQKRLHVGFRDADGSADVLAASRFLPPPLDVIAGMLRLKRLSMGERVALLRVASEAMRQACDEHETVASMLARCGQSRNAQERLWNPMAIATMNTHPDEGSAALFLEVLRRAFLGKGDDSRLAIPRAGLSELFAPASDAIVRSGGTVELSCSVTRIEKSNGGFIVHAKDRDPITTDNIVVAVPPTQASTLLNGIVATSFAIETSPIVSIYMWYDRALNDIPMMTALIGTSVQWVFNRRRMMNDEVDATSGLLSCTISAAVVESLS